MKRLAVLTVVVVLLMVSVSIDARGASGGDNWPAWRGPDATGAARNGNPPITWSETESVKWKVKVPGDSLSSPIIWADKIFYLTAIETDKKVEPATDANKPQDQPPAGQTSPEQSRGSGRGGMMSKPPTAVYKFDMICMDRKTGNILWQKTACQEVPHEGHHPQNGSFAAYSPVSDGKYIWAGFGSRGVYCYDMDGNLKWSRDLGNKMKMRMSFGEGSSPALAGVALIVVMDNEGDSFIYALNKETGETIWQKTRDEKTSWATPLVMEVNGKMQVVTSATKFIRCYDVKTGDIIWQCSGQTENVIPTPVSGFGKVFCTSGYRRSSLQAIELGHTGDLSDSNAISWNVKKGTPYVPSPLLFGDKIYVCSVNKAVISCYQATTGKAYFVEQPLEGMGEIYASPVGVADRAYFVGRDGITKVIKKSNEFQVLATNKLDDKFDASPAIAGNELFLKGKVNIYCITKP